MKIAIAKRPSVNYEIECWTNYCNSHNIDYIIVDPYDTDVVSKVKDCSVFLWHHTQTNYKDLLFANQLLFSMQQAGKTVYPDFNTNWHFDDKVGQKYLLEAIDAPLVKSYVFYDKAEALKWAKETTYPKVFKLRCGAASTNVKLVHSYNECKRLINKAFGKGYSPYGASNACGFGIKSLISSLKNTFFPPLRYKYIKDEKGYVYFQDFMAGNTHDTRVIVIDGKYACAEKRFNRKGDFRASGSGSFSYEDIDINIVKVAFEIAKKLQMQSVAFDFVYDEKKNPKIVEICFGFGIKGILHSPGYFTDDLNWHTSEKIPVYEWILEGVLGNTLSL